MSFASVIPAVLTPFDDDLALAPDRLAENVRGLAAEGIRQVVACGTMGEAGALSREERREVVAAVRGQDVDVVVGVSAADQRSAAAHAEEAAAGGAMGIMCLPPVGYHADDRELRAFYSAVAGATGLPVMLYNNPEAARNDLTPAQIAGLAESEPAIVAVKECSGDARRIAAIRELCGDRLTVLVGGDDWALEGYAAGARGWVSGVANVAPAECLELERLVLEGDLVPARELWSRLLPLCRLDMTPKLVQLYKTALDLTGRHGGPVRPPRLPLAEGETATVRAALATLSAPVEAAG